MNKDRRERRKLAKQIRQAEKPHQNEQGKTEPQNISRIAKIEQALGYKFTEWQKHDLNWFLENPGCNYYLRKPFPGEWDAQDIPPPYAWLVLIGFTEEMTLVTDEKVTLPLAESRLVAPQPANGLDCLMSLQDTPKGQEALRAIWEDYSQPACSE